VFAFLNKPNFLQLLRQKQCSLCKDQIFVLLVHNSSRLCTCAPICRALKSAIHSWVRLFSIMSSGVWWSLVLGVRCVWRHGHVFKLTFSQCWWLNKHTLLHAQFPFDIAQFYVSLYWQYTVSRPSQIALHTAIKQFKTKNTNLSLTQWSKAHWTLRAAVHNWKIVRLCATPAE